MSAWWYVGGAALVLVAVCILLVVCCSAKLAGPDTDQRDPYSLAGRPADSGVHWCCCYCAAPSGVDHPEWCPRAGVDVALDGPDGRHDVLPGADVAGELLWLYEAMPEAALLDLEPDAQGDVLPPPVVPGWNWRRTDDGWASGA